MRRGDLAYLAEYWVVQSEQGRVLAVETTSGKAVTAALLLLAGHRVPVDKRTDSEKRPHRGDGFKALSAADRLATALLGVAARKKRPS